MIASWSVRDAKTALRRAPNPGRFCQCTRSHVRHTRAGISQRHGVPKHRVTDERTQGAPDHYLYTAAQQLLKINDKSPWKPGCSFANNVDKQVHIAFSRLFPSSHRAENLDIAGTMEGSN